MDRNTFKTDKTKISFFLPDFCRRFGVTLLPLFADSANKSLMVWPNQTSIGLNHSSFGNSTTSKGGTTGAAVLVVFILLTCVSLVGNSLVIYIWYSKIMPQRDTFLYIANLAKSDLLLTSASLMFLMEGGKSASSFGDLMCKAGQFLGEVSSFASVLTLVAIGHHRYSKISTSLAAIQQMTTDMQGKIRKRCGVIWLTAAVISAPVISAFSMIDTPSGTHCVDTKHWPALYRIIYYVFRFVVFFCLPLAFLVFSYCHMYLALQNQVEKYDIQEVRRRANHSRLLVAIVTTFFVCVGPKIIVRTVEQFEVWEKDVAATILYVVGLLLVAQPALNPVIYGISSPEIRKAFRSLFKNCRKRLSQANNNDNNGQNNNDNKERKNDHN